MKFLTTNANKVPFVIAILSGYFITLGTINYFVNEQTPEQKLAYLEARKDAFKECMQLASANKAAPLAQEGGKSIVESCNGYSYNVTYHLR